MKKTIILGIILFSQNSYAQEDPTSINPNGTSNTATPNIANFIRFQESYVNHYNGRGNFSIPIYEINVGGIKYPISLNYSQGGIQVNSMASDVGLGWSLSSCFINRTIIGDPDLETIIDIRQYSERYKYGYFDYQANAPYINGQYVSSDFYPDLFRFISPINSSNFYFKNKNQVVELDQKESRINWDIGSSPRNNYLKDSSGNWINNNFDIQDYNNFDIVTKDGLRYFFQNKDITHSFVYAEGYTDPNRFGDIEGTFPRVSSWYASKISNLNNNEEINFTYETYSAENSETVNSILFDNRPFYRFESFYPTSTVNPISNNLIFPLGQYGSNSERFYNRQLDIQRIKKISFRGGSIEFNYGLNREDLTNGKALTSIVIKDIHNNIIKEFEFEYGYFNSFPNSSYLSDFDKRLKLLSVREKGQNKYEFDYYEDGILPPIGSVLQDFFGFSNNNNDHPITTYEQKPKYYYYPNKNEFSILPYNINNTNHYFLEDENASVNGPQIDREPNELSKTWSLKKVKFPTGGSNTYILESNTFNLWGNNLKGGGTRLKQQILQEQEGGPQRIINYNYNKDANTTSGYLFNVPQVGYPASILFPNTNPSPDLSSYSNHLLRYFLIYNTAKVNYDLLHNFFIGYSKVEENEDGIKTVHEFTNEEEPNRQTRSFSQNVPITGFPLYPVGEFIISNSSYGNDFHIDNSYKRGKLKNTYYYDKYSTSPIMKKEYIYKGYEGPDVESYPDRHSVFGTYVYNRPGGGAIGDSQFELMQFEKSYNTIYNNLAYTKTTKYLSSGNIEDENYMYYDSSNQNLLGTAHKIGNGTIYPKFDINKYIYPLNIRTEPGSFSLDEVVQADELLQVYKDNKPMLSQSYSGEFNPDNLSNTNPQDITSQSKIVFSKDANTSNIVLPVQILAATGESSFHELGKFDRYDSKGNLLQSTDKNFPTTYIYGYLQTKPIAVISGATYQEVLQALNIPLTNNDSYLQLDIVQKSDLDKDQVTENNLLNALESFRTNANLSKFSITTYTYNPLVGITTVTPPSGIKQYYLYDSEGRLKEIRENSVTGNILKEYNYNYKH